MSETYMDRQYYKFSAYGFLKNLRFFEPFFILALLSRGVDYLQIGSLYAIREVTINLMEIPTGLLADSWGRKKTMMTSFVSYIAAFLILYRYDSYALMAGAMIFYAFGDACRTGTHKSMIFDYIRSKGWSDQKSAYYGHTRGWSQKGSALSALIAGLLVFTQKNYNTVFLFSIIPYVLDFFLIATYPAFLDKGSSAAKGKKHILKSTFEAMKNSTVLKKTASVSLFAGYYKSVKDYLQPILQTAALAVPLLPDRSEEERSSLVIGLFYFLIFLLTSRASSRAGAVNKRFPNTSGVLLWTLILGAGAGLAGGVLYHFGLAWAAAVLFLLIFVLENIRKPIGIGYLGEGIEPGILATILSVESQGETLWTALFALGIGAAAHYLSLPAALAVCSALLLAGGLFTVRLSPKKS